MKKSNLRSLFIQFLATVLALGVLFLKNKMSKQPIFEDFAWVQKSIGMLIEVCAWFVFGWFLTGIINTFVFQLWEKKLGRSLPKLLKDIINAGIYLIIFMMSLSYVFQAPLSGLIASSSVVAAIVGLAITRMISDVFSGAALSLERAYNVGDWLEIEMRTRPLGYLTAEVVEINWRATRLLTKADETLIIPNSEMARMKFVNFSMPERHYRTDIQVYLSHTVPPERAKRILEAAIKCTPGVMKKPAFKITLMRFTEKGVLWVARIYIADYSQNRQVCKAAYENVLRHLQVAGIDLSYNRVDQHIIRDERLDMEKRPVKERLVRNVELFDALNQIELRQLAESMQERIYSAGETIVAENAEGSSLFIVAEGLVGVWKDSGEGTQWVANIEPGHYFGEMSLLTGQPRSATVKATTEVICFEIDKEIILPIFRENIALLEKTSQIILKRQHHLDKVGQEEKKAGGAEQKTHSNGLMTKMMDFFGFGPRTNK